MLRSCLFAGGLLLAAAPGLTQAEPDRRAALLRQRAAIDAELRALDAAASAPAPAPAAPRPATARPPAPPGEDAILVEGRALPLTQAVRGQTVTTIDRAQFDTTPATTLADMVRLAPGVSVIQGNGPRDTGISIRGSNARNSFGARNIQVFEDDFPVTQPDGLARFDLTDPHAYAAIDVVRGPSSARYGNYATGGALNFRTRSGADIQGLEFGLDGGNYGYANLYATLGGAAGGHDYALFGSLVRGDGSTAHTGYQTGTINARVTLALSPRDRLTAKLIYNESDLQLSTRLSYADYRANPYQRGCARAATRSAGCGVIQVFQNGISGARIAQSAAEADLARHDRRTIAGVRWEHDLSATTTWRTQAVFDSRVVFQPTNATPFKGTLNSYTLMTDLTDRGRLFGLPATGLIGLSYGFLDNSSYSFNKTPAGRNGLGALTQTVFGTIRNVAGHAREEITLVPDLQLIAGIGAERSELDLRQTSYSYAASGTQALLVPALRRFWNVAPEAALLWQASAAWRLHARIGTGYGIPQSGALFVTPQGVPGNNSALKAQRNTGVDIGAELGLGRRLHAELTGFYEWFRNEQVTQSAGVDLMSYTFNAPRSVHRGVEAGLGLVPLPDLLPGLRLDATYSYDDQRYTRYVERLSAGGATALFDRAGRRIPGVAPHVATGRLGYSQSRGPARGLGGFIEVSYRAGTWIDNGNHLRLPGYTLANLSLFYDPPGDGWLGRMRLFAAVQNLFDRTYIGSAAVIADSLDPVTGGEAGAAALRSVSGSIYAGAPRTIVAGVRTRL
ncbi:TonB-dependent receptor family protein [Sphingomonas morindae]|uniref:TonB-dependent receptor n=1 Tax=Sphingomonas morindae TaxID=1541170 RepID=A0ABY4XDC9_9SPHN|nr:TonB-dependent receptor [Sphingomonas morindae]USI74849.1 TonB-dependent receptor [Sphingomonas morindae]